MRLLVLQWNLSVKDPLHKGHLSNEDTVCSPNHIDLCTSLYIPSGWPVVSTIERLHYIGIISLYTHANKNYKKLYTTSQMTDFSHRIHICSVFLACINSDWPVYESVVM